MNFAYASRPFGRLIFFASLALLLCVGSAPLHAQLTKTTVRDTIHRADGSPAAGTLLISWPSFFTAQNDYIVAGSTTVELGEGGAFSVPLAPTDGGTPAGVQYRVVLQLAGSSPEVQYWTVPVATETGIHFGGTNNSGAARPPAPDPVQWLLKSGDTMTGPLTLSGSPTDPDQAATKQYVDDSVAPAASKQYVDSAVAAMAPRQYVDDSMASAASKQYVDAAVAPMATRQYVDSSAGIPVFNIKNYGAKCDGSTDDTAAFNSASAAALPTSGTVYIPGFNAGCKFGDITLPGTKVLLQGKMLVHTALVPDFTELEGIGSAPSGMSQFQTAGLAGYIVGTDQTVPTLELRGSASHQLKNLKVDGQIKLNGTKKMDGSSNVTGIAALAEFVNVSATSSTLEPFLADEWFWFWCKQCRFLASPGAAHNASIHLTETVRTAGYMGVAYFDDTIISGYGILVDSTTANTPTLGALYFTGDFNYENVQNELFTIDTTNVVTGGTNDYHWEHFNTADPIVSPASLVKVIGLQPLTNFVIDGGYVANGVPLFNDCSLISGSVKNLTGAGALCVSGSPANLKVENVAGQTASDTPAISNKTAALPISYLQAYGYPGDLSAWNADTSATVTSGQADPFGGTTAQRLTCSTGSCGRRYDLTWGNPGYVAGDTLVFTYWWKADAGNTMNAANAPLISLAPGDKVAPLGSKITTQTPRMSPQSAFHDRWNFGVYSFRVTDKTSSGAIAVSWSLTATAGQGITYAYPAAYKIAVSTPEAEVVRILRSLGTGTPGVPAGAISLPDVPVYLGPDTYIKRVSGGVVGVNGSPIGGGFDPLDTTTVKIKDDFMRNTTASGGIGELGWVMTTIGGTPTAQVIAGVANHFGIAGLATTSTQGQGGALTLNPNGYGGPLNGLNARTFDLIWIFKLDSTVNLRFRIGLLDNTFNVAQPSSGLWLRYDTTASGACGTNASGGCADTSFTFEARNSSTSSQSTVNSVAANTAWHKLRIRSVNPGTVLFSIDGGTETSITTNLPAGGLVPGMIVVTDAAASKTPQVDYFGLSVAGITR